MPVRYTSRLGLSSVIAELSGRRREVFDAIAAWDSSRQGPGPSIEDLARTTGRKECSICGRLNELRELGCIELGPMKTNTATGKPAMTYIALVYREPARDPILPITVDKRGQLDFAAALRVGQRPFSTPQETPLQPR